MNARVRPEEDLRLDADALAALRRFDDDARTLRAPSALRARATSAYRAALTGGAGRPHDRSWAVFVRTVAMLVRRCTNETPAASRLRALVAENADVLA